MKLHPAIFGIFITIINLSFGQCDITPNIGNPNSACSGVSILITFQTENATGATYSNLPPGVLGTWANNTVTITGTPSTAGSFPITVNLTGCSGGTNSINHTIQIYALPTVSAGANQTICAGANVTLSGSGASSYAWNNNVQDGVAFTPNATTTYTVTGTATNGCTNTAQTTVTVNALPALSAGANQTICAGANVTLSGSGASSYAWNNNVQDGVAFTPNATTTYTVTGTDANGCTNTAQTTVTVNALPAVSAGANQTICAGANVTLSGSGASSYAWNNNVQDGVAFTPNATTTYTVTGTDANGCTNTAQTTVTVNTTPSISLTNGGASCANGNVPLNATSVGAFGGFWSTTNGAGTFAPNVSNASVVYNASVNDTATVTFVYVAFNQCGASNDTTTINILGLPSVNAGADSAICTGTNTILTAVSTGSIVWNNNVPNGVAFPVVGGTTNYIATATGANQCTNTDTVAITGLPLPQVNAGQNQTICAGSQVTLSGSGAQNYTWDNNVLNGVPFSPTTTQTYTVTVIDSNFCQNTAQVTVTVNPSPTVSGGTNQTICAGALVTLNGSGASSYSWNNNVQNNVSFTATQTTTYTVTGTDANGCQDTAQVTVTVNPLPTVSGGLNQAVCAGQQVTLNGTGAATYTWDNNVQNGVAFTPTQTNQYTVTGTSAAGCQGSAQVLVTVNQLPNVGAGQSQTVCAGTAVTLNGSGASTYAWNNNVQNNVPFTATQTSTYTVTGTNGVGCTNTAQVTITVNPLPTVSGGLNQAVCAGNSVTLTGSGANTYAWNNNVQNGVVFTPTSTQTYIVTGTNANGCIDTAQVVVTVNQLPVVSGGPNTTICAGDSATLNGSGASTYAWNNGITNGVIFIPNSTMTYTVTGTDANGCQDTAQVTLTVSMLPSPVISGDTLVCQNAYGIAYTFENLENNTLTWQVQNGELMGYNGTSMWVHWYMDTTDTYLILTETDWVSTCSGSDTLYIDFSGYTSPNPAQVQALYVGSTVLYTTQDYPIMIWGYEDKITNVETIVQYQSNQYCEFGVLDTVNFYYWVKIADNDSSCLTKSYYNPPVYSSSIQEINSIDPWLSIYPNPADDFLHIQNNSNDQLSLIVFDNVGRIRDQKLISSNSIMKVDVTGLNPGTYFLRFDGGGKKIIKQLVKMQ